MRWRAEGVLPIGKPQVLRGLCMRSGRSTNIASSCETMSTAGKSFLGVSEAAIRPLCEANRRVSAKAPIRDCRRVDTWHRGNFLMKIAQRRSHISDK